MADCCARDGGCSKQSRDSFPNLFAERLHPRAIELPIGSCPAKDRPDYVVFSNDYATGPELLRLFDAAGIRTFLAYSGISDPADRQTVGAPRRRYKGWLGSLEPLAQEAGYVTAHALIARKGGRTIGCRRNFLFIGGDRSTTVSIKRNEGARRAVAEAGNAVIDQEVYAARNREGFRTGRVVVSALPPGHAWFGWATTR